jgi:hypothetical protein
MRSEGKINENCAIHEAKGFKFLGLPFFAFAVYPGGKAILSLHPF